MKKIVAIVGSRHRAPNKASENIALIKEIIDELTQQGEPFTIISLGCDTGFGKDVKDFCNEKGYSFAEVLIWFNGPRSKEEFNHLFLSRNSAIAEAASMFYLAVSAKRSTHTEDLLAKVRLVNKPFKVYNDRNALIEYES